MDNGQIPPVQVMPPVQTAPGGAVSGMPMMQQVQAASMQQKDTSGLVKTVAIVLLSLVAVTFVGLFIWVFLQYNEVRSDVDGKIALAVSEAKDEQAAKDEEEFAEREKNPYRVFSGPADYGQLTFEYPKTWSVYVAADASNGGTYSAYFNPIQVNAVSKDTINALRVTIENRSFESVAESYQRDVDRKDSRLTVESVTVGNVEKGITVTANRYTGVIPGTDLNGCIVIFKIRDKTAILQTDSVLFEEDFDKLLSTIVFNA